MNYSNGGEIARTILSQLGGAGKLVAMTGAYNFVDRGNGLSFKIKNAKSNFIKITLTSLDLYDIEIGRIRGNTYKVVAEAKNLYADQLKPFIEKTTGMYLSLFARGGDVYGRLSSIMKSEDEEAKDFIEWEDKFVTALQNFLKVDRGYAEEVAQDNENEIMAYYYKDIEPQDAAFLLMYSEKQFASGGNVYFREDGYKIGRPTYLGKELLSKVNYNESDFVGNFGWRYEGKTNEGYLLRLDDYDAMLIRPDMIKSGERVFRYINDKSVIGGIKPLIKINYEKGLIYFLDEKSYESGEISFDRKGIKALWITFVKDRFDRFEDGGEIFDNLLDDFNLRDLDAYETMQYKHLTERGMTKVDALKFIINNVEGDYSQLSPKLSEVAEIQVEYMAKGGKTKGGNVSVDLFEFYEQQPPKLRKIVNKWLAKYDEDELDYKQTEKFLKEVEAVGYTFDYGLDNMPYGLRPIGTELKMDWEKGGIMAKGGMATFDDKVQAISKRLEGTKVPKRLEKDYGKRYNHEEAVQAGRRIAGSIRKKYGMADGGTVGESKYTDAEIRRAMKNFFVNPNKIEIIKNDDAYFAVVTEDFFINDEWYINYDEYGETVYKYFSHIREYNYPNDLRILLYYPIKKGYELDGSADLLEDDSEYFEN